MYSANAVFTEILSNISKDHKKNIYDVSLMITKGSSNSCNFYVIHRDDGYLKSNKGTICFGLRQLLGLTGYGVAVSVGLKDRICDVLDSLSDKYGINSNNIQLVVRKEFMDIKKHKDIEVDGVLAVYDCKNNNEPIDMVSEADITKIILNQNVS